MKGKVTEKLLLFTGLAGFLSIFFITWARTQPPLFDEVVFIPNIYLFEQHGLSAEFLRNINEQAPGPLYQFVHYPLKPFTNWTTPGIRLVNVFLLGLLILLLARILVDLKQESFKKALVFAISLVAVPMVWQVSGLALTEMPTMFFAVLSALVLNLATKAESTSVLKSTLLALLAGVCLGLAILGRSPFLLLAFAAFALLYGNTGSAARWRTVILYAATGLSMAIPVFLIWGGLVPPQQAFVSAGGINVWHGILAFAYGALLTLIIAPHWFYFNRRVLVAMVIAYFVFLVINRYLLHFTYYPLSEALKKIVPASFMEIYPYIIAPAFIALALWFIASTVYRGWQHRTNELFIFLLLCGLFILATSAKVTHLFSTRYVAQAAPFFVLVMAGYDNWTTGKWVRSIIGMILGVLSLQTYFHFQF